LPECFALRGFETRLNTKSGFNTPFKKNEPQRAQRAQREEERREKERKRNIKGIDRGFGISRLNKS